MANLENIKYFKKLVGKNVYLSPFNPDDAIQNTIWMNNLKLTNHIGQSFNVYTLANEKEFLEQDNSNTNINFCIVRLEDNKLLGNCSITHILQVQGTAEIGIFIGDEENWGKGYGTEAIKLLIDFGFNYLNLNNIMLKVFSFNERAIKSYEKVGFKVFGRRHQTYRINNEWYDDIFMEILREDYYKNKKED